MHGVGGIACGRSAARRGREIEEEQGTQHGGAPAVIRSAPLAVAARSPRSSTFCSLGVGAGCPVLGLEAKKTGMGAGRRCRACRSAPPRARPCHRHRTGFFAFLFLITGLFTTVYCSAGTGQGPGRVKATEPWFFFI
jgi:hypothetical protein